MAAPGTPENFPYAPSNNSVMASPIIFGPTIIKIVLKIAAKNTAINWFLRGFK